MRMEERMIKEIKENCPDLPKKKVLLAVSGGVDSMLLLDLFTRLPNEMTPQAIMVVHINHQLREVSDDEANKVAAVCQKLPVDYIEKRWEKKHHPQTGIENAARAFRYQTFMEIAEEKEIDIVVTAHHGDDQVETMLMKLTRGTNLRGVAGISSWRSLSSHVSLWRPLLLFNKNEIREEARKRSLWFSEDESNLDFAYQRNRFRHQVLPLLKEENINIYEHFQLTSQSLLDLLEISKPLIEDRLSHYLKKEEREWLFDHQGWQQESSAWQRILLEELCEQISQKIGKVMKVGTRLQILNILLSTAPQKEVRISQDWYFIKRYTKSIIKQKKDRKVSITSLVMTSEQETVRWEDNLLMRAIEGVDGEDFFYCDASDFPLMIRHRQAGDRIRLKNGHHQKLKKWLIDYKIPQEKRESLWIVENVKGEILTLLGYGKESLFDSKETGKMKMILIKEG